MLLSLCITVISFAAMFAASAKGAARVAGVAKMAASTGFVGLAIAAGALQTPYGWAILAALFFSWWGDLFLISKNETLFLLGLAAFFLGHVAFVTAFVVHGVNPLWAGVVLAVLIIPATIVAWWLNPGLGEMRIPVYAYIVVITCMVACAAGAVGKQGVWFMLLGAFVFYCSDLFVARDRFVKSDVWNSIIGLPLYYAGQLILAYTTHFAV